MLYGIKLCKYSKIIKKSSSSKYILSTRELFYLEKIFDKVFEDYKSKNKLKYCPSIFKQLLYHYIFNHSSKISIKSDNNHNTVITINISSYYIIFKHHTYYALKRYECLACLYLDEEDTEDFKQTGTYSRIGNLFRYFASFIYQGIMLTSWFCQLIHCKQEGGEICPSNLGKV